jgi:1-aminocyclopropane-1-carboxylate deaminase/D-cysteine desulfhydrase-like pyridoxal-dependent ACC family enzyme
LSRLFLSLLWKAPQENDDKLRTKGATTLSKVPDSRRERREYVRELLTRQPRVNLAVLPTPLEPLPRLTAELGGPNLFIKRDDLTGLAFGGNKTRQLEYVMADVLRQEPKVLVTGANIQSNWCRQATAAAVKLGIPIVLVLRNTDMQEIQGNVLLDLWMGAQVRFVDEPDMTLMDRYLDAVVADLRAQGKRAVKLDPWAPTTPLGYIGMMAELDEQCEALGIEPTHLWLAAAGPTQAGLVLGARLLEWPLQIVGVTPIHWTNAPVEELVARTANESAELLGVDVRLEPEEVCNLPHYVGLGYAIPTAEGLDAMRLAARTDAILLDPVYTGKAMAGLIDRVHKGALTRDETVIFLHTGGLPANFAFRDAIVSMLQ